MRFLLLLFSAIPLSGAADWPQFLGLARDSRSAESVSRSFPDAGPKILWKHPCGAGFAGPVVAGGQVILFHRQGADAVAESLDALTGAVRWKQTWLSGYKDDFGFDAGPRSCPTVEGDQVFFYGAEGILVAADLATGKIAWRKDLAAEMGSGKGFFGRSCAPLVAGDLVLLAPGGEGAAAAAFDRQTGALKWKALDAEAGYASPVLMKFPHGKRAVFFTREGVAGIEPATGMVCFSQPFRSTTHASVNAATPVVIDETHFFTTASYDTGAAVWSIGQDDTIKQKWHVFDKMDCHYSTPVLADGFLYGFHGRQETGQELRCVSVADGEVKWSQKLAAGQVIAAGKTLVILTEQGELVLAGLTPERATILDRGQIINGGHRAPPALANGRLYAKDKSQLVCVDLPATP